MPPRELWVWFDIISVPQNDRVLQMKAIGNVPHHSVLPRSFKGGNFLPGSLCAYTHLITRFIPLVRDANAWLRIYGEVLDFHSGTLATCDSCSRRTGAD